MVEPTSWASPKELLASADAWYHRTAGKANAEAINQSQQQLDKHLAIDELPWLKRHWAKLDKENARVDGRFGIIIAVFIAVLSLVLASLQLAGIKPDLRFLYLTVPVAILMFVSSLWTAQREYRKLKVLYQETLEWTRRKYVMPSVADVTADYLDTRLVAPTNLPIADRLQAEGQALILSLADLLILSGLENISPTPLDGVVPWRNSVAEMINDANAVMVRLTEWVETLRQEVRTVVTREDGEGSVEERLQRYLPEINEAMVRIAMAETAMKELSLKAVLASDAWGQLMIALHFNTPTIPVPASDTTT